MTEDASPRGEPERSRAGRALDEEALAKYGRIAGVVVVVLAAVGAALIYGPGIAVLVLTAGLLFAAILAFWTSIRALFGETPLTSEDAFALGAPTAEHEQKRAVLRAIKDLEFERTVGKISEEDYAVLMGRYRAEAKRLLRVLDDMAAPARARVEKLVEQHLASLDLGPAGSGASEDAGPFAAAPAGFSAAEDEDDEELAARICPACAATNDPDAVFCKKCAARLQGAGDDQAPLQDEADDDEADDDEADDDEADDDEADEAKEDGR